MSRIYLLKSPEGEVIYVGATKLPIHKRLKDHYFKMREAFLGKRKASPLQKYLLSIAPLKVTIHLIEECTEVARDQREIFWIAYYKNEGLTLLNATDGGCGGHTSKYKTDEEMTDIKKIISSKNKGKPKPKGFAENLSIMRTGAKNPSANPKPIEGVGLESIVKFKHSFEIDAFFCKTGASSNVYRVAKETGEGKVGRKAYGYTWRFL